MVDNFPLYSSAYAFVIYSKPEEAHEAIKKTHLFFKFMIKRCVSLYDKEKTKGAHGGNIVIKKNQLIVTVKHFTILFQFSEKY